MALIKDDLFSFRAIKLPLFTPDLRDRCQAAIEDAKAIRDKDLEALIKDLMEVCDRSEAALRMTYRTLTRYRENMPNLIRKFKEVKEENR